MTVDLESRLTRAFEERAATTPIEAWPMLQQLDPWPAQDRRRRWPLVAAIGAMCAIVGGVIVLSVNASSPNRTVSSPGFDGEPILLDPARFVPLGLDGVPGWQRVSFTDRIENRTSFCTSVAPDGSCAVFVGATLSTYQDANGKRIEVTNEFGPSGAVSNMWQMTMLGSPIEVRGRAGAQEDDDGDGTLWTAWTESPAQRILVTSPKGEIDSRALVQIADELVPSPATITTSLVEVRSFDTDDNDPTSVGEGYLALLVGRIDGKTCVALIGFNGNVDCGRGFEYGDGPKAAIAGRAVGSQRQSLVAAILPAGTATVQVERFQLPTVDVQPISVVGFDERFVLELMGTAFPTRVHALDTSGGELSAFDVDPLFEAGFARGILDGRTWDLSAGGRGCLYLSDVSSSAEDCSEPPVDGITTGVSALSSLQFGKAGSDVAAVSVNGVSYPTIAVPDGGTRAWIAPLGGWPVALDAHGAPLDDHTSVDVVPSTDFCGTATAVTNGEISIGEMMNGGLLFDVPELSEHQQLLIGVGINHVLASYHPDDPWDNTMLVDAVNQVCRLALLPSIVIPSG